MKVPSLQDEVSYRAVDIPPERILTINSKGELRRTDVSGYVSTYMGLALDAADFIFPPLTADPK